MTRAALLAVVVLAALPAWASAATRPGSPPAICAGGAFSDRVGTPRADQLFSGGAAERIYGLGGPDWMTGSSTRATCLFGGAGDDFLNLNAGGGVAWGEEGRDTVYGSRLGDVADGGPGVDLFGTGPGPDKLTTRDGRPELVNCGDGEDIVRGDRADVFISCEAVTATGPPLTRLKVRPRVTDIGGTVRARLRLPARGTFHAVYVTPPEARNCSGGPSVLATVTGPKGRNVRLVLHRPERGWCEGRSQVAVVRDAGQGLPGAPVARFAFRVL